MWPTQPFPKCLRSFVDHKANKIWRATLSCAANRQWYSSLVYSQCSLDSSLLLLLLLLLFLIFFLPLFIFPCFTRGANGISSPIFLSMKMSILQIEVSSWEYEDDLDTKKDRTRSFLVSIQKALEWYCHNLLIKLCTVFFLLVMRMLFWEGILTTLLFRSYCNFFPIRLSCCHSPFPSPYLRCHGGSSS